MSDYKFIEINDVVSFNTGNFEGYGKVLGACTTAQGPTYVVQVDSKIKNSLHGRISTINVLGKHIYG